LRLVLELQHTEAILSAVEAGLGIGCVSRLSLRDACGSGRLHECAVPGRAFGRHFFYVLHRQKYRSVGIQRWLELCRAHAA
jgi:DNA-binding transcriptional LysR family regulator